MHKLALILFSALSLASSSAFAEWYRQNNGTIVDPIQKRSGGKHHYSGNNLEPGAFLSGAFLDGADLTGANLFGANLRGADLSLANLHDADLSVADLRDADLTDADLTGANLNGARLTSARLTGAFLTGADLTGADLAYADLTGANLPFSNLSGANLANVVSLNNSFGSASYDINTDFTGTGFDPVAAGWTLVPVPEPSTALLIGLGLAGLAIRRR